MLIRHPPPPVDAHNEVIAENQAANAMRMQPPITLSQEFYRGNVKINDFDGPLVLPPLSHGLTFVVTSSLMQMLTARGLFLGLPLEYPHAHLANLRAVCKSCVGRPDLDMNVIGFQVFPLSLVREAAIWITELPYKSIYT